METEIIQRPSRELRLTDWEVSGCQSTLWASLQLEVGRWENKAIWLSDFAFLSMNPNLVAYKTTLGKLLNLPGPQLPYLYNGANFNICAYGRAEN